MLMSIKGINKERIEEIFLAARGKSAADRDEFLQNACGEESDVRLAVENLLKADQQPDSLLDGTLDLLHGQHHAAEVDEGHVIDRYKILERIGEGGFGIVYMAQQFEPVRRKVAIKLIKPGMDSKEVVARFEAERQALAMMDHPNIARVLDAGTTESGRPYFVMELVKGVPITEYCDHNNLAPHQRLELFSSVCLAVQHAHHKGVIHRDIKPSNVMVTLHDGKAVPKVIDFGVAKALSQNLTEKTLFTRYGQVVGTPQYMSPEQAEMSGLDVDTRSDIYSLGVLLYELLTGKTPLDATELRMAGYEGIRKLICDGELAKPSATIRTLDAETATCVASHRATGPQALVKLVSGDLDWIVMKCLDKDRDRRYDTANNLATDIGRYLSEEPVEAGPPSVGYQLSKFYRRNRAAVGALSAIGASLLVGISLTTIAWANESKQRAVAEEQRQIAQSALANAEENEQAAREQAAKANREAIRSQSTLDVIKALLTKAGPHPERGAKIKVSELLGEFAKDLDAVKLEDPAVEIEVRLTLADALSRFSMSEQHRQQLEAAERIARRTYQPRSEELMRFLVELSRRAWFAKGEYLKEALSFLDDQSNPSALEVEIRTELGNRLHWDTPAPAQLQLIKACDIARKLPGEELATLRNNPYRALAESHWVFREREKAESAALEAVAFANKYGTAMEQVESGLFMRHFADAEGRKAHYKWAWEIAEQSQSGEAISRVLNAACGSVGESYGLWDDIGRPDLGSDSHRLKNDMVANWPIIHRSAPPVGHLWGLSILTGNSTDAEELESLSLTMASYEQGQAAFMAAKFLRKGGMLRRAEEMYDLASTRAANSHRYLWHNSRCRSAARDFLTASDFIGQEILRRSDDDITSRNWQRVERGLFLDAAGEELQAQQVFAEVLPDLAELKLLFVPLRVICIWKLDRWDEFDAESLRTTEAKLKNISAKGSERDLGQMLSGAALGLLAEHRGDRKQQIEYFVTANRCRPGTYEQINGEWIAEKVVQLLSDAGQTDRLEELLRQDVEHRDTLPKIHPERAVTRIRLAQLLAREGRDLDEAHDLLAEAKKVYSIHGDWIPAKEHKSLDDLQRTVESLHRK